MFFGVMVISLRLKLIVFFVRYVRFLFVIVWMSVGLCVFLWVSERCGFLRCRFRKFGMWLCSVFWLVLIVRLWIFGWFVIRVGMRFVVLNWVWVVYIFVMLFMFGLLFNSMLLLLLICRFMKLGVIRVLFVWMCCMFCGMVVFVIMELIWLLWIRSVLFLIKFLFLKMWLLVSENGVVIVFW